MSEKKHFISIWFFIGTLLAVYGVLIAGAGVYQLYNPHFDMTVDESNRSVLQGRSASYTVTIQSANGFTQPVWLRVKGSPPAEVTASWQPESVTPPHNATASSTLTLAVGPSAATGTYGLALLASSAGHKRREIPITLRVKRHGFTAQVDGDRRTTVQGEAARFTVTVTSDGGFSQPVELSAENLPVGHASGTSWSATTITPPPDGTASATLSIYTNSTTRTGKSKIMLRAASKGFATQQIPVVLTVEAPEPRPRMANLHAEIWWGLLLVAIGGIYCYKFFPGRKGL
jgi:hypothetical protein